MQTLELSEITNRLDAFVHDDRFSSFIIGEMVGCNLLRQISELLVSYVPFNRILFVSGIQDDVYAGTLFDNHVFWGSLFDDNVVDGLVAYNGFLPKAQNPNFEYSKILRTYAISQYQFMVIHQAHKIPRKFLDTLTNSFVGKTILIVDPFDHDGENWSMYGTCVDTFERLSPVDEYARYLYGIDTRAVNRKSHDSITYGDTISLRSVGKVDDKQYVTLDPFLYDAVTRRQMNSPFRKRQKLIVVSDKMNLRAIGDTIVPHAFTNGTLLHIDGVRDKQPIVRIHASKVYAILPMAYEIDPFRTPSNVIHVMPANIIPLDVALQHRFTHVVFVTTPDYPSISIRDQYALMKISQNITFVSTK